MKTNEQTTDSNNKMVVTYSTCAIYTLNVSNKHLIPNNLGVVVTPSHVHVVYSIKKNIECDENSRVSNI